MSQVRSGGIQNLSKITRLLSGGVGATASPGPSPVPGTAPPGFGSGWGTARGQWSFEKGFAFSERLRSRELIRSRLPSPLPAVPPGPHVCDLCSCSLWRCLRTAAAGTGNAPPPWLPQWSLVSSAPCLGAEVADYLVMEKLKSIRHCQRGSAGQGPAQICRA